MGISANARMDPNAPAEQSKSPTTGPAVPAPGAPSAGVQPASPAPQAASPSVDPAAFADLQKQLAKATKELAAEKSAREEQGGVLGKLRAAFGGDEKKDPLAELNTLKQGFESTRAENARLKAERAVEKAARAHEAIDEDEHFDAAIRAGVVAPDFTVEPDALSAWLTKRKAERAHLFKAAPVAAEPAPKGAPPAPGTKPPAPVQPVAGTPAPTSTTSSFSAWIGGGNSAH